MNTWKMGLLMVSLVLLASCTEHDPQAGLILYRESDPFIETFARKVEEFSDGILELTTIDSENSQILQNEQIIEYQKTHDPKLMIINPVDRLSTYSLIRKQKELDVPVIFFNREPLKKDLDLWDQAYYVGARAEQSGALQAELIMELFGGDPEDLNRFDRNGDDRIQALILKGEPGHQDAEIRTEEVVRVFTEHGYRIDTVIDDADWEYATAYEHVETLLKEYGDTVEVILSNNDAMALGAIDRMREEGYFADSNGNGLIDPDDQMWIPVVGIDGIADAVEMIKQGYLYGTVINDSERQARAIIELTEYILGTRSLEELNFQLVDDSYIWVDYQVFTLK